MKHYIYVYIKHQYTIYSLLSKFILFSDFYVYKKGPATNHCSRAFLNYSILILLSSFINFSCFGKITSKTPFSNFALIADLSILPT